MKTAAIIGAGNIGRGFIGQIMSEGGYEVCFIDVAAPVVDALNERHEYPLEIVRTGGSDKKTVKNVRAVNGNDHEAAARVIADCDICVTCVGAKAIKFIIPNFVAGVKLRFAEGKSPINLLICENLMDADKYIKSLLEPELTPEELDFVGLVETSVGRMVPLPDKELLAVDPLIVRAEAYPVLPCDKDAFKGEVPEIKNVIPVSPFRFIIERKLYIHNMGHAVCAYFGKILGHEYICDSIADPNVRLMVQGAMLESAEALATKYSVPQKPLLNHAADLIRRFGNRELGDTCQRVGNDIPRKLANSDRLTGAALQVFAGGSFPVYICTGSAAALYCYVKETGAGDALSALCSLTGLDADHEITKCTMKMYAHIAAGETLPEIIAAADEELHQRLGMIV